MGIVKRIVVVLLGSLALACNAGAAVIFQEVPFTWQLATNGDTFASAFVDNEGGIGNSESDSDTLAGNFVVSTLHAPPAGFTRVDALPTQITLNVLAKWLGSLSNSTFALDPFGLTIDTFVKSTAVVSAPPGFPAFTPATEEIGSATTKDINQQKNLASLVGPGAIPFSGSVDIQTLFGFGSGTFGDFATGAATLELSGSLVGPTTVDITYKKDVPEAPTVFLLLGGLLLLARRLTASGHIRAS